MFRYQCLNLRYVQHMSLRGRQQFLFLNYTFFYPQRTATTLPTMQLKHTVWSEIQCVAPSSSDQTDASTFSNFNHLHNLLSYTSETHCNIKCGVSSVKTHMALVPLNNFIHHRESTITVVKQQFAENKIDVHKILNSLNEAITRIHKGTIPVKGLNASEIILIPPHCFNTGSMNSNSSRLP